jgi:parallel beta-helix repeat protein
MHPVSSAPAWLPSTRVATTGAALAAAAALSLTTLIPAAAAQPGVVAVDCDAGTSLAQAVADAADGDTIEVSGTCDESVHVARSVNNITITGDGSATITGPDASTPPTGPASFTFFIEGQGITLQNLTITGGAHAIHLSGPASATILDNTITNSAGAIHLDKDSTAQIGGNTITNNLGYGINIQENSYARIGFTAPTRGHLPNTITDNQGPGIIVKQWSGAWISGNDITGNTGHGVEVDRGSHAEIYDNTINNNAGDGIRATNGSGTNLGEEGTTVPSPVTGNHTDPALPNGGVGVRCSTGGYVSGDPGTLTGAQGHSRFEQGCINSLTGAPEPTGNRADLSSVPLGSS